MKRRNTVQCQVCGESEAKYKCPVCQTQYCSVGCFKKHKESICQSPYWLDANASQQQQQQQQRDADQGGRERGLETEDSYRVSDRQLNAIAANEAIRRALGNGGLCDLLVAIDGAQNRERALDDAITTHPEFAPFLNAVLQTIGVRDLEGNCVLR